MFFVIFVENYYNGNKNSFLHFKVNPKVREKIRKFN